MKPQNTKPTQSSVPSPADVWADEVADLAAKAMADWLKSQVHLSRPISSIKKHEMKALASVVIHNWIIAASHRVLAGSEINPAERQKLKVLLS